MKGTKKRKESVGLTFVRTRHLIHDDCSAWPQHTLFKLSGDVAYIQLLQEGRSRTPPPGVVGRFSIRAVCGLDSVEWMVKACSKGAEHLAKDLYS